MSVLFPPLFFCLSRQPSVLSTLLLIFIFLQDFNCFVLPLSCPTIVSAPIMSYMCGFTTRRQGVDSRILSKPFSSCVQLPYRKYASLHPRLPLTIIFISTSSVLLVKEKKSYCKCCSEIWHIQYTIYFHT